MLTCENYNTSEIIYADRDKKEEIRTLSRLGLLRCKKEECCHHPVIFKCGSRKIPHFAHKTPYPYLPHDSESYEHLLAKDLLRTVLTRLFPTSKVDLEIKIVETDQETDVLVTQPDGQRLAFEYQRSKLTEEKLEERHYLYELAGIRDFWILSSQSFFQDHSLLKTNSLINGVYKLDQGNNRCGKICFLDVNKKLINFVFHKGGLPNQLFINDKNFDQVSLDLIKFIDGSLYSEKYREFIERITEEERIDAEEKAAEKAKYQKMLANETFSYLVDEQNREEEEVNKELHKSWRDRNTVQKQNEHKTLEELEKVHNDLEKKLDLEEIQKLEKLSDPSINQFMLLVEIAKLESKYQIRIYRENKFLFDNFIDRIQMCSECSKQMFFEDRNGLSWNCKNCNIKIPIYQNINNLDDVRKLKQILQSK